MFFSRFPIVTPGSILSFPSYMFHKTLPSKKIRKFIFCFSSEDEDIELPGPTDIYNLASMGLFPLKCQEEELT